MAKSDSIPKQCRILKRNQRHHEAFDDSKYDGRIVDEECHYQNAQHGNHCPANGCLEQKLGLEMTRFHWAQGIIVSFKRCNANFAKLKAYIQKQLERNGVKDEDALKDLTWYAIGGQTLECLQREIQHTVLFQKHPLKKLKAKELLRLMRFPSGHPDQEGEIYTRFDVIDECQRRGKQLLIELGWPTKMNALYWSVNDLKAEPRTLREIIGNDRFEGCKGMSRDVYRNLSIATDFEFDCTHTGLECTNVKEWKEIIARHPTAKPLLYKAIEYEKAVWEYAIGHYSGQATAAATEDDEWVGEVVPIAKHGQGPDDSTRNVTIIARWLGIDVNTVSDVKLLTEADPYHGVWHLLEYCTPEKPTKAEVLKQAVAHAKREAKFSEKKSSTLTLDLFS